MSDENNGIDSIERSGDHLSLKLAGQLTISNSVAFNESIKQEIEKPGMSTLGLDGSQCQQIDTAGFQLITALIEYAKKESIAFKWVGVSESMVETSRLLGLQKTLGII